MGELVPFRRIEGAVEELSDEALLSATGQHEQAALGALFDRFQADVYRFVARVAVATPNDVDDLVVPVHRVESGSPRSARGIDLGIAA